MTDEIHNSAFHAGRSEVTVSKVHVDDVAVLSVVDVVDAATASELTVAVKEALAAAPKALVIDLTAVTFLASAGMTVLIKAKEQAGTKVGFAVVANSTATSRPLKLLGLDTELAMCPTLDAALERVT